MTTRFIKAATLLACAVFSTLALAADPPARVGRVALAQGQVSIAGEEGDEVNAAQVNWPVTSHKRITTARGARTEIRIGSTSVRLDGDTSLDVDELDDDNLRLRLDYGSVNVRIRNAEALAGFVLATPNGQVRLQEPGRLRVDAGRVPGATAVNVFDGVALVDDRGSQLIVRAGKRADISDDDVRTGAAQRDSFDDWTAQRDQYDDSSTSARYVTSEMTGYEDLDRNGAWRDDPEYGPLWLPTVVAPGWAPYRDGSWTWIAPWGWTWVDNAPWGYAPFHYGRWVQVDQRWAWAPGRQAGRPVWAPALVGWVGGSGWDLSFGSDRRRRPAQGWYPLTPRDSFVPGYRLSQQHLQHLNRDVRPDGRGRDWRPDHQREGLTVVPHEQFARRGTIGVRNAPRADVTPQALQNAPAAAPAAPQGREGRDRFERVDRIDRDSLQRNRQHRPELSGVPAPQMQVPAAIPGQPSPSPFSRRDGRPGFEEHRQQPAPAPAPVQLTRPATVAPPPMMTAPAPIEQASRSRMRMEGERRMREPDPGQPAPVAQPRQLVQPPVFHQQAAPVAAPAPAPAPVMRQAPPPAAAAAASAESAPRPQRGGRREQER
ncbi:MAG TPA: DUF6600 domain-containing protein [Telluria sp.]|nr:DUF6600 domain-containing protein [Telluria sp.]